MLFFKGCVIRIAIVVTDVMNRVRGCDGRRKNQEGGDTVLYFFFKKPCKSFLHF